jgi:hypothetical protein
MKEVSSIMSETNLLDSDDDESEQTGFKNILEVSTPKLSQKVSQLQEQVNKLKMLKQSNNFDDILLSLNDEDTQTDSKKSITQV